MLLNIGAHVLAHTTSNNQTYNSEIISRTKTYYICKKLRTLIDNKELLYYTDEKLNIDINVIKHFIAESKDSKTLNYKKRFFGGSIYTDVYDVNLIKIPIHQ